MCARPPRARRAAAAARGPTPRDLRRTTIAAPACEVAPGSHLCPTVSTQAARSWMLPHKHSPPLCLYPPLVWRVLRTALFVARRAPRHALGARPHAPANTRPLSLASPPKRPPARAGGGPPPRARSPVRPQRARAHRFVTAARAQRARLPPQQCLAPSPGARLGARLAGSSGRRPLQGAQRVADGTRYERGGRRRARGPHGRRLHIAPPRQ